MLPLSLANVLLTFSQQEKLENHMGFSRLQPSWISGEAGGFSYADRTQTSCWMGIQSLCWMLVLRWKPVSCFDKGSEERDLEVLWNFCSCLWGPWPKNLPEHERELGSFFAFSETQEQFLLTLGDDGDISQIATNSLMKSEKVFKNVQNVSTGHKNHSPFYNHYNHF